LEESDSGLIEVLTRNFPGGTEENHENSIWTAGDPAEIRTEYFLNTNLEHCDYTNLLGTKGLKRAYLSLVI
jgi:hypothetical protein